MILQLLSYSQLATTEPVPLKDAAMAALHPKSYSQLPELMLRHAESDWNREVAAKINECSG